MIQHIGILPLTIMSSCAVSIGTDSVAVAVACVTIEHLHVEQMSRFTIVMNYGGTAGVVSMRSRIFLATWTRSRWQGQL